MRCSKNKTRGPDKKASKMLGVLVAGAALLELLTVGQLVWILTAGKTSIIVRSHYAGWRGKAIACGVVGVVGAVCLVYDLILWRRNKRAEEFLREAKERRMRRLGLDTPEGVYDYVEREGPREVLAQLDKMNLLQKRLDDLLTANGHEVSLKEAKDLLQAIEDTVCLNVKKAVNYRLAGGEEAFKARLPQLVSDNDGLLSEAEGILMDLAEFINNGKGDIGVITQRIADYRETINAMLEEEEV